MEAVASTSTESILKSSASEELNTKKDSNCVWKCSYCNLEERYDYKGTKPPFAKHLTFLEDCYIMKDPFSPINKNKVLVLGGDCSLCQKSVCMECSFFYTKRFCKNCAYKNIKYFPINLQERIKFSNHKNNE